MIIRAKLGCSAETSHAAESRGHTAGIRTATIDTGSDRSSAYTTAAPGATSAS